ncbi:MAG: GNAT family N-acetyltransferase [Bacteroidetes bacterium]|nr:GNAT family N-acetyltransferase [Bacteroidota bacterium]
MSEAKVDLVLRPVEAGDEQFLLDWANQAEVRNNAINPEQISASAHHIWFGRRLTDPETFIYIALFGNKPLGQIRFELHEGCFEIDYSVDAGSRGMGIGAFLLKEGINKLRKGGVKGTVAGLVKPSNFASIRAFRKAGFSEAGTEFRQNTELIRFEFQL